MNKPPFKMLPSRAAQMTRDGKFWKSGRASFVWEQFLISRACGVPGEWRIRKAEKGSPWHTVEISIEEAERELGGDWGGMRPKARVERVRKIRAARQARGLEVA